MSFYYVLVFLANNLANNYYKHKKEPTPIKRVGSHS
nr:MAG TPA: hypothetical protein [Caudoviricetes sp.]